MDSFGDMKVFVSRHGPAVRSAHHTFTVKERKFTTKYAECGILPMPFWASNSNSADMKRFIMQAGCPGLENRQAQTFDNVEVSYDLGEKLVKDKHEHISFMTESLRRQGEVVFYVLGDATCGYPKNIISLFNTVWHNTTVEGDNPAEKMLANPSVIFPGNVKDVTEGKIAGALASFNFVTFLIGKDESEHCYNGGLFATQLIFSHYKAPEGFHDLTKEGQEDVSFELFMKYHRTFDIQA
jgi:hypothetical protein